MQATVRNGQWLADIAVEKTGSIAGLFEMAALNGISVTDDLNVGSAIDLSEVKDEAVVQNYKVRELNPATATETGLAGIGYWAIGTTLIVA